MNSLIDKLTPLKGASSSFHTEVRKLQRPYVEISEQDFNTLMSGQFDYYKYEDKVVTFGKADGSYALMPLQAKFASEILEANK